MGLMRDAARSTRGRIVIGVVVALLAWKLALVLLAPGKVMPGFKANTRGQVYTLDEERLTATVSVNADLGRYSLALGSTQKLSNGHYWFDAGFLPDASGVTSEVNALGNAVFALRTAAPVYRSYRLPNMYGSAK